MAIRVRARRPVRRSTSLLIAGLIASSTASIDTVHAADAVLSDEDAYHQYQRQTMTLRPVAQIEAWLGYLRLHPDSSRVPEVRMKLRLLAAALSEEDETELLASLVFQQMPRELAALEPGAPREAVAGSFIARYPRFFKHSAHREAFVQLIGRAGIAPAEAFLARHLASPPSRDRSKEIEIAPNGAGAAEGGVAEQGVTTGGQDATAPAGSGGGASAGSGSASTAVATYVPQNPGSGANGDANPAGAEATAATSGVGTPGADAASKDARGGLPGAVATSRDAGGGAPSADATSKAARSSMPGADATSKAADGGAASADETTVAAVSGPGAVDAGSAEQGPGPLGDREGVAAGAGVPGSHAPGSASDLVARSTVDAQRREPEAQRFARWSDATRNLPPESALQIWTTYLLLYPDSSNLRDVHAEIARSAAAMRARSQNDSRAAQEQREQKEELEALREEVSSLQTGRRIRLALWGVLGAILIIVLIAA